MLVIPVTTFGLGTWQVFRLQWKLGLIDELERKTKKNPVTIPTELVIFFSEFLNNLLAVIPYNILPLQLVLLFLVSCLPQPPA